MSVDALPTVGIIVVNYYGDHRTLKCLASIEVLTWPAELLAVVLVDNGSDAGFLERVRRRFPWVRVVVSSSNLGFGGACNLGFEALQDCAYIALLNNDAVPEPGWLEPLVEALENDPLLGAATPKVLLEGAFVRVELRSPSRRPGRGDPRALGVQLCGARVDGDEVSERIELASGFWGWEHDSATVGGPFAWTNGLGVAYLPTTGDAATVTVEIRLAAATTDIEAEVTTGQVGQPVTVGVHPAWVEVTRDAAPVAVVNNAGTILQTDGSTADRGYLEPDDGAYDDPADVSGWSGAAVLLNRRYLEDVGGFDDRFFLYYEDADLSWRGRLRGWNYRYEPRSTVRHEHSATVGRTSALAAHLSQRNRLVMLTKCAPRSLLLSALASELREVANAVERDVVRRLVTLRKPVPAHAARRVRVLAGYLRLLPHAVRSRVRIQRSVGPLAKSAPRGMLKGVERLPASRRPAP